MRARGAVQARIAREELQQVGAVGGGVDPAQPLVPAALVRFAGEVLERGAEQLLELRRREERRVEVARRDEREGERVERAA